MLSKWLRGVAIAVLFTGPMPQRLYACLLEYRYSLEHGDRDSLHLLSHSCRLYLRRYYRRARRV